MKKLIIAIFVIAGTFAQAQEIKWMTLDEALAAQKKLPKPKNPNLKKFATPLI
jgi:hypothetical protein